MSRIHDALKKAEQDRAASAPPPVELNQVEPLQGPKSVQDKEEGPGPVTALRAPLPTLQGVSPLTLEGWIADCPSLPWKPDARAVLFADPKVRQLGMEEFRTLRTHLTQMRE